MEKVIDGKQDIDNTQYVLCKCGRCFHSWQEPLDESKMVIPRGCVPKTLGFRSQCPKCRRKDVFLFPDDHTNPLLEYFAQRTKSDE